jgi:hypothetical protein
MAGPRTFGGWVVVNHGEMAWLHICRLLVTVGLAWEYYGERPTMGTAAKFRGKATTYRDHQVFRKVFPDDDPIAMYERMKWARKRSTVEDRVVGASVAMAVG